MPRRWLGLSGRRAQLRLTVMYAGMFLALGTAVIVVIFLLARAGAGVEQSQSVAAAPGQGGGSVIHAAVQQHSADNARLLAVSWLALALTAVASAFLGWFAAGRVLRPLRKMTATARTISAGNLHERLALTGPDDEFRQLGDTVDDLLRRLEASFSAQRRFVANAAHELRTPLTLERTLLQVALADPSASAATLRATCEELLVFGRGQERVLESLLTLASSERGLETSEEVDLAAVVERVLGRVNDQHPNLRADLATATVRGDPPLLERLVANLVENALRHSRDEAPVEVRTSSGARHVVLSIANSGAPIDEGEVERLFEPFQRLEGNRTSPGDGHGLGLSIVRAIATAHDATVEARPRAEGGLAVTVSFPPLRPG